MRIDPNALIAQAPGCLAADMGEELVVMNTELGLYFSLDAVGKDIWTHLASPCTFAVLCDRLCADYATTRTRIETDVAALLQTLRGAGTIEIRT